MDKGDVPRTLPKPAAAALQSFFMALYILLAFLAVYRFHSKLAMASLAASAFIAFAFPAADSAQPKHMAGGYVCGVVCGGACCFLLRLIPGGYASPLVLIVFCALSVFFTSLCMILLDMQHPPAAALAVSMVLETDPLWMGLSMLACVAGLCLFKWLVIKWLGPRLPKGQ